jgi:hypothetical protein
MVTPDQMFGTDLQLMTRARPGPPLNDSDNSGAHLSPSAGMERRYGVAFSVTANGSNGAYRRFSMHPY